jgi:hypothetical protein
MCGLITRLGARGTVALALGVLVVTIIGIAKIWDGNDRPTGGFASVPRPSSTIEPTAGDDAEVAPTPTASAEDAAIVKASRDFTAAWLRRELSASRWHDGLTSLVTPSLARRLESVDPAGVPATRMLAPPTLVLRSDGYAQTATRADTGTLRLGLVERDGRWLIDTVDWERL